MSLTELTGNPRHDQLLTLIADRGYMNIDELAQLLDVSTQTAIGYQRQQLIVTRVAGQFGKAHGLSSENHHAPHFIQKVTKKSGFDHSRVYPRARRALCVCYAGARRLLLAGKRRIVSSARL